MIFYIILILLAILLSSLYWTPKLRDSIVRKANPQLIEKILTGSDGSIKANQQIKQILISEGNNKIEVNKAIAAATVKRQGDNQSKYAVIMGVAVCLVLLSDVLLSPISPIRGVIVFVSFIVTLYAFKRSGLIRLFKKKQ